MFNLYISISDISPPPAALKISPESWLLFNRGQILSLGIFRSDEFTEDRDKTTKYRRYSLNLKSSQQSD